MSMYVKSLGYGGTGFLALWFLGASGAVGWSASVNWADFLIGIVLIALSAA